MYEAIQGNPSKQAGAGGDRGIKKLTKSRTASGKPGELQAVLTSRHSM